MALRIAAGSRMLYVCRLIDNAVSLGDPICRPFYLPSPLLTPSTHCLSLSLHPILSVYASLSLSASLSPSSLSPLFPKVVSFPGDFSYAAAGLVLLECKAGAQWSAELLVITYGGGLRSYLVRWVGDPGERCRRRISRGQSAT